MRISANASATIPGLGHDWSGLYFVTTSTIAALAANCLALQYVHSLGRPAKVIILSDSRAALRQLKNQENGSVSVSVVPDPCREDENAGWLLSVGALPLRNPSEHTC